jgi:hypothetical protein
VASARIGKSASTKTRGEMVLLMNCQSFTVAHQIRTSEKGLQQFQWAGKDLVGWWISKINCWKSAEVELGFPSRPNSGAARKRLAVSHAFAASPAQEAFCGRTPLWNCLAPNLQNL